MTKQLAVTYDVLTREAEAMIRDKMNAAAEASSTAAKAFHDANAFGAYRLWSRVAGAAAFSANPAADAINVYNADRDRLEALVTGRTETPLSVRSDAV